MNHKEAQVFVERALPFATPEQRLVVRGVSFLESTFGQWGSDPARGAGSNNMGAITDPSYKRGKGVEPNPPSFTQFLHTDSRPAKAFEIANDGATLPPGSVLVMINGTPNVRYTTAFKKYPSPEAGFADVGNVALKPNVKAAILTGSLRAVSSAMFDNHYYTGVNRTAKANIDAHAKRLIQSVSSMTAATGEPNPFLPLNQESELKANLPLSPGYPSSAGVPLSSGLPSIRFGSKGPPVGEWQRILKTTIDEDFGPMTRRLTREWQAAHNLIDDGIVGPNTWSVALGKA